MLVIVLMRCEVQYLQTETHVEIAMPYLMCEVWD